MICRTRRTPSLFAVPLLLLFTLVAAPALPAEGEQVSGAPFATPPEDGQETRLPPDPDLVPEVVHLPPAEVAAPAAVQALRQQTSRPGVPYRNGFLRSGTEHRVEIATAPIAWVGDRVGDLQHTGDAAASWLGRFVVDGAHAFRVRLRDLALPPGARIWLYAGDVRLGPFSKEMLSPDGDLWLPPAPGPEVVVEIELAAEPSQPSPPLRFAFGDVMELVETSPQADVEPQAWTACDIDAMCIDTQQLATIDMLREATARLSFVDGGSSFLCTGGLLNDKDDSGFRPYLLTANHCFDSQSSASSLVAYFDYRTDGCNGTAPSLWSVPSVSGATLLATDPVSDFTFVELSATPSGSTWFLGWTTADPTLGTGLYRVSHPAGTPQKYSASSFVGASGIVCSSVPTSDFHYSEADAGSTTGGSSGAPVTIDLSGDARVVGQLLGVCRFSTWDDCNYGTYNYVDGAFSTTFPYVRYWLNDLVDCADAWEPDDSSAASSPIFPGDRQGHSICPAGDEDWVSFTLGVSAEVVLETSGPSGDTRMWLYDSGLSQIEFDDDGGTSLFSRIDRTCGVDALPAGTYHVKVDEFGDNDVIDAYDLGYTVPRSCDGSCPPDLVLANTTITGTGSYRAGGSVTLGPGLTVDGTSIEVVAGERVVIGNGTAIGGTFSAATDPAVCSL